MVWDIFIFEMFQPLVSTTGYIFCGWSWLVANVGDLSTCHPKMVVKSKGSVAKIPETFRFWNYSGYTCPNDSCVIIFISVNLHLYLTCPPFFAKWVSPKFKKKQPTSKIYLKTCHQKLHSLTRNTPLPPQKSQVVKLPICWCFFQLPKNDGISKLMVWRSQTPAIHSQTPP